METARIQIGVEGFIGGQRVVRLTPIDRAEKIDPSVAHILKLALNVLDATDMQKGDGEVDIPVKNVPTDLLHKIPGAEEFIELIGSANYNVFIRIK